MAMVRPVFKKGSRDRAAHYRPISLTCAACKIMKSIVRNAMCDHLVVNSLISLLIVKIFNSVHCKTIIDGATVKTVFK